MANETMTFEEAMEKAALKLASIAWDGGEIPGPKSGYAATITRVSYKGGKVTGARIVHPRHCPQGITVMTQNPDKVNSEGKPTNGVLVMKKGIDFMWVASGIRGTKWGIVAKEPRQYHADGNAWLAEQLSK